MRKSWGVTIGAAAVVLTALTPGVALAAPAQPTPPDGSDITSDTTTTFTVTSTGTLLVSAPSATALNATDDTTLQPGGTISAFLGTVTVTDLRAVSPADWDAQVTSTPFTTGTGTANQTIPAADVGYATGTVTSLFGVVAGVQPTPYTSLTGATIFATGTAGHLSGPGLSATPATVVTAVGADGDNQASWDPTITVNVPSLAVGGTYSGTITHSVIAP